MKFSKSEINKRWQKIRIVLEKQKSDGILVSSKSNLFYLSNFQSLSFDEREAFFLITQDNIYLLTSLMYQSQFAEIFDGIKIETSKKSMYELLLLIIENKSIGFEEQDLKVNEYNFLKKKVKKLTPIAQQLKTLRSIKSLEEIQLIKVAEKITQKALNQIMPAIKPGQTEKQIAKMIELEMEKLEADGVGFPSIIASGSNSGVPHHNTRENLIQNDNIILMDIGAKKDGYSGDLTRTIFIGNKTDLYQKTYDLVQQAHDLALSSIKAGAKIADIDLTVRNFFQENGVLDYYIHTTGHGLGIALHEFPSISYKTEGLLEEGMVITIEPGLYYDWGGVRIEDVVSVTKNGFEPISKFNY